MKDSLNKLGRNSGLDYLRILSMLMIIGLHYCLHCVVPDDSLSGINYVLSWSIESLCYQSVNIFVLITGYFSYFGSCELKNKRIARVAITVWFYSIFFLLIAFIWLRESVGISEIIQSIFPLVTGHYWFATAYIILLVIEPFYKKYIVSLNDSEFIRLLIVQVLVFCFVRTVMPLADARFLSNGGASIGWFLTLYLTGYSINKYHDKFHLLKTSYILLIDLICVAIPVSVKLLCVFLLNMNNGSSVFYHHNCAFMYIGAISTFLIFERMQIKNWKPIRTIGSATFGIYLIHENVYTKNIIWETINKYRSLIDVNPVLYEVMVCITLFTVCALLEIIRELIFKLFNRKGNKS